MDKRFQELVLDVFEKHFVACEEELQALCAEQGQFFPKGTVVQEIWLQVMRDRFRKIAEKVNG